MSISSDPSDPMRLSAALCALATAALLLTGCGTGDWAHRVGTNINPDSASLADRCAQVMQAAMPWADIDVTSRTSQNTGIDTMTARVTGTRTDNPPQTAPRDLAVECKFDSNVLVGFRWTQGAPTH